MHFKKTLSLIMALLMLFSLSPYACADYSSPMLTVQTEAKTMVDITNHDSCYEVVQALQKQHIVQGDGHMHFHPNDALTTDAAALLVCRAFYPKEAGSVASAKNCLVEKQLWPKACCDEEIVCQDSAAMLLGAIAKANWKTYDPNQYYIGSVLYNGRTGYAQNVDPVNGATNLKESLMLGLVSLPQDGIYVENLNGILRKDFCIMLYKLVEKKDDTFFSPEITYRMNIVQWGKVEDLMADDIYNVNKYLPKKLLSCFTKENWRVYFTNGCMDNLAGDFYMEESKLWMHDADGFTSRESHFIAINVAVPGENLIHEFGHYLDYKNGMSSNTMTEDETEVNALITLMNGKDYLRNAKQEYFAEAFMEYCLNPAYMKKNCPKVTAIIETDLANIPET